MEERWRKGGRKEGRAETCHNNEFLFKDYGITDYYCTLDKTLFCSNNSAKTRACGGGSSETGGRSRGKSGFRRKKRERRKTDKN